MITYPYDPKAGYQFRECQICKFKRKCTQHHIGRGSGRQTSEIIWICIFDGYLAGCHEKVHNPTAFGLPSDWAYKRGYLVRNHNNSYKKPMEKKEKKNSCSHSKGYFDRNSGKYKCQFCGKFLDTLPAPKKKKEKNS